MLVLFQINLKSINRAVMKAGGVKCRPNLLATNVSFYFIDGVFDNVDISNSSSTYINVLKSDEASVRYCNVSHLSLRSKVATMGNSTIKTISVLHVQDKAYLGHCQVGKMLFMGTLIPAGSTYAIFDSHISEIGKSGIRNYGTLFIMETVIDLMEKNSIFCGKKSVTVLHNVVIKNNTNFGAFSYEWGAIIQFNNVTINGEENVTITSTYDTIYNLQNSKQTPLNLANRSDPHYVHPKSNTILKTLDDIGHVMRKTDEVSGMQLPEERYFLWPPGARTGNNYVPIKNDTFDTIDDIVDTGIDVDDGVDADIDEDYEEVDPDINVIISNVKLGSEVKTEMSAAPNDTETRGGEGGVLSVEKYVSGEEHKRVGRSLSAGAEAAIATVAVAVVAVLLLVAVVAFKFR